MVQQVLYESFSNIITTCDREELLLVDSMFLHSESHNKLGLASSDDALEMVRLICSIGTRSDNLPNII